MSLLADLTATSAPLLLRGLYAVVTLCTTPYLSKNSSTALAVKTLAPSEVNEIGIPKMAKYSLRDAFKKKKTVKFGTLAQKVGGGQAQSQFFFHILIGTNTVGGRGSKGPCHKKIQ